MLEISNALTGADSTLRTGLTGQIEENEDITVTSFGLDSLFAERVRPSTSSRRKRTVSRYELRSRTRRDTESSNTTVSLQNSTVLLVDDLSIGMENGSDSTS